MVSLGTVRLIWQWGQRMGRPARLSDDWTTSSQVGQRWRIMEVPPEERGESLQRTAAHTIVCLSRLFLVTKRSIKSINVGYRDFFKEPKTVTFSNRPLP